MNHGLVLFLMPKLQESISVRELQCIVKLGTWKMANTKTNAHLGA